VIQESLAKVQAHSDAERVEVSLEAGQSLLEVGVQDNGRGFDPETVVHDDTGRGVGLVSMRERAELLGGKLSIESGPGLGCRVLLSIPLEEAKLGPDNGPAG
jgi:signal transduction histidine kinase